VLPCGRPATMGQEQRRARRRPEPPTAMAGPRGAERRATLCGLAGVSLRAGTTAGRTGRSEDPPSCPLVVLRPEGSTAGGGRDPPRSLGHPLLPSRPAALAGHGRPSGAPPVAVRRRPATPQATRRGRGGRPGP